MFRNVFLAGRISTTGTSDDKTESSDPVGYILFIFSLFYIRRARLEWLIELVLVAKLKEVLQNIQNVVCTMRGSLDLMII